MADGVGLARHRLSLLLQGVLVVARGGVVGAVEVVHGGWAAAEFGVRGARAKAAVRSEAGCVGVVAIVR